MGLSLVGKPPATDAVLQKHIRAISSARDAKDEANGAYLSAVKEAKNAGCPTKELIHAMKDRARNEETVKINLRNYVRCLALCNIPLVQTDLFAMDLPATVDMPSGPAEEHELWEAQEAGRNAGKLGRSRRDNPHMAGSELFVEWDKGYLEGQQSIAMQMAPKAKVASTRRKRSESESPAGLPLNS